jgi:hypothetical protein
MTPLGIVSLGLIFAFVDLRIDGFDLVPDVVGWIICAFGFARLEPRGKRWKQARQLSIVSAAWQALLLVPTIGDIRLGFVELSVLGLIEMVLAAAFVATMCTAIIEAMSDGPPAPDFKPAGKLREAYLIRAINLALSGIAILLTVVGAATRTTFAAAELLLIVVPLFATYIWLIALASRLRAAPEMQAA